MKRRTCKTDNYFARWWASCPPAEKERYIQALCGIDSSKGRLGLQRQEAKNDASNPSRAGA